jgi:hypothetical protein
MTAETYLQRLRLTTTDGWVGVWVRSRSGPTVRGNTIDVDRWHRVSRVDDRYGDERLIPVCRPRSGQIMFPGGGGRLEIARPTGGGSELPGSVCPRCLAPLVELEVERLVSSPLDDLVDDVLDRMRERAEQKLTR